MADRFSAHRSVSYWMSSLPGAELTPRPSLPGDTDCDVAVVGAGFTGLWTAYELARRDPSLRIVVLEKEIAGYGASGRNGGWCSGFFAASHDSVAAAAGRDGVLSMQRAMNATVDEVGAVCRREGIDCDFTKGGTLLAATNRAQARRLRKTVEHEHAWGLGPDTWRWLEQVEAEEHVRAAGMHGAAFTPNCAALHPGKLVRGLASVVEGQGTAIWERTGVREIRDGVVRTKHGRVRAEVVVRATEAFTPRLRRMHRLLIPLYSLMLATEPLPDAFWKEVGWAGRETFGDARRMVIYAQRTADDRIAFGGRGHYHFGSTVRPRFDRDRETHDMLEATLRSLFPGLGTARVTHRWGGPVAAPRDWFSSVGLDRDARLAWAGGYVGDGVSTANLAGRTLADLICGLDSDLVHLPWVGHPWRKWEPEPLRWLGVRAMSRLALSADAHEARSGRVPWIRSAIFDAVVGK